MVKYFGYIIKLNYAIEKVLLIAELTVVGLGRRNFKLDLIYN